MLGTPAGWLLTVSLLCARRSADHEQPPAAALAPALRVCVFCVLVLCGGGVGADEERCATNNEYAVFDTAKRFANLHKHAHTLLLLMLVDCNSTTSSHLSLFSFCSRRPGLVTGSC